MNRAIHSQQTNTQGEELEIVIDQVVCLISFKIHMTDLLATLPFLKRILLILHVTWQRTVNLGKI